MILSLLTNVWQGFNRQFRLLSYLQTSAEIQLICHQIESYLEYIWLFHDRFQRETTLTSLRRSARCCASASSAGSTGAAVTASSPSASSANMLSTACPEARLLAADAAACTQHITKVQEFYSPAWFERMLAWMRLWYSIWSILRVRDQASPDLVRATVAATPNSRGIARLDTELLINKSDDRLPNEDNCQLLSFNDSGTADEQKHHVSFRLGCSTK